MDIDELVKKAKEIGHDHVPDPKPVQAERKILEVLNSEPKKCFQKKTLNILLEDSGVEISDISPILTRIVYEGKCEKVKNGIYRARLSLLEKIKLHLLKIL